MRAKRRILTICLILLFLSGCYWLVFKKDSDLVYEGKSMQDWFDELPLTLLLCRGGTEYTQIRTNIYSHSQLGVTYQVDQEVSEEALLAFSHFGTNALPYLMEKVELQPKQANRWRKFYDLLGKSGIKLVQPPYWLHDPEIRRMKAASVLLSCESLKDEAIVEFTKLKTSPEFTNRSMAGAILHFLEQNEFE